LPAASYLVGAELHALQVVGGAGAVVEGAGEGVGRVGGLVAQLLNIAELIVAVALGVARHGLRYGFVQTRARLEPKSPAPACDPAPAAAGGARRLAELRERPAAR